MANPRPDGGKSKRLDISQAMSGLSPEARKKLNALLELTLDAAQEELKGRIEKGEFKGLSLKEILSEIGKLVRNCSGPNTSITAIQIPQAPQLAEEKPERARIIEASVQDPEKLERLRESQRKMIENGGI